MRISLLREEIERRRLLASHDMYCQHNWQWLWLAGSDDRTLFNSWQHLRCDGRRSRSVDNSCVLTPSRTAGDINIWNQNITMAACEGWSKCGNKISGANFCIVFNSNYGSILLSFRDMTTWQTVNDGRQTTDGPTWASMTCVVVKGGGPTIIDRNTK